MGKQHDAELVKEALHMALIADPFEPSAWRAQWVEQQEQ
jgi:hypothetical protein